MKISSGVLIATYQIIKLNMHFTCILPYLSHLKKNLSLILDFDRCENLKTNEDIKCGRWRCPY